MTRKYFGTDGIRGRANGVITPDLALKVGQATGLAFRRGEHRHRVVIGKDTRLSGYMIEYAMVAGFTAVGMDVMLLGPMPTTRRTRRVARPCRAPARAASAASRMPAWSRSRRRDAGFNGMRKGGREAALFLCTARLAQA